MNFFLDAISLVKKKIKTHLLVSIIEKYFLNLSFFNYSIELLIEDYRLTCCVGLLKYILMKYRNEPDEEDNLDVHITSAEELKQMKENVTDGPVDSDNLNQSLNDLSSSTALQMLPRAESRQNQTTLITPKQIEPLKSVNGPTTNNKMNSKNNGKSSNTNNKSQKSITTVPIDAIEFAIDRLNEYIDFKLNNDLDIIDTSTCTDDKWTKFYEWFYAACQ
jgi:hypothetical protein